MKQTIIGGIAAFSVAAALGFAASNPALAQNWLGAAIGTANWPTVESEAYKVEAFGSDLRVYEWQTKSGATCVAATAEKGPFGIQCF